MGSAKKALKASGFKLPTKAVEKFIRAGDKPRTGALRRTEASERIAVYLPPELAEELRVRCARERRSVSDAVSFAVAAWLGKPYALTVLLDRTCIPDDHDD